MNRKGFHHLTWNDRLTIEKMLKIGTSKAKIAEALGVCERTVYYEIKRGLCTQQLNECDFAEVYCADVAERIYRENLKAKGPDLKVGNDYAFVDFVEHKIMEEHYSPGAVLAEIRAEGLFETRICESTLYNYIYGGDVFLELTPEHLHEKGRRHQHRPGDKTKAAKLSRGESIEHRPEKINARQTVGHWEMDSVMGTVGSSRALVVLTERVTRAGIIILVPDHTAASVVRALNGLERKMGKDFYKMFKSITVDNGCEFADCKGMEKSCRRKGKRTQLYYCHPYTACERGSNENMNRIIRRFFPKGTNFDKVSVSDIRKAEAWLNKYPRKVLGWRTSESLLREYMAA